MSAIERPADHGFFGPHSVTWKVFTYPTSLTVGFQRTVVTEMLEPFLLASVTDTGAVMTRPALRYDRTLQYVATVAFADSASVVKASDVLMRIHSHIRGLEPLSGLPYDANDPEAQLWIHLTQWHSVLLAYEMFGPGPLPPHEEERYWAECRRAAAFQTIDPETVPRNRAEMRAYYDRMRPRLAATEATQEVVEHLLSSAGAPLDAPAALQPAVRLISASFRRATIATLPHWMRRLAGVRQSRAEDAAAIAAMRAAMRIAVRVPGLDLAVVRTVSPATARLVEPVLRGVTPAESVVRTPEEAWAAAGRPTPREQWERLAVERAREPLPAKAPADPGAAGLLRFA